jgi:hypothetical protein
MEKINCVSSRLFAESGSFRVCNVHVLVACRCNCLVCRTCERLFWRFSLTGHALTAPAPTLFLYSSRCIQRYTLVPHTFTINKNKREKKKEEVSSFHLVASLSLSLFCVSTKACQVCQCPLVRSFEKPNQLNSSSLFFVCCRLRFANIHKAKGFFFFCLVVVSIFWTGRTSDKSQRINSVVVSR